MKAHLRRLRKLRECIHDLVHAAMTAEPLPESARRAINKAAAASPLVPVLVGVGARGTNWTGDPVEAALSTIARDAIDLITCGRIERIQQCEGPDCSLLFYDDSQSGKRRWCSMERCGNLAKIHAYRQRQRCA